MLHHRAENMPTSTESQKKKYKHLKEAPKARRYPKRFDPFHEIASQTNRRTTEKAEPLQVHLDTLSGHYTLMTLPNLSLMLFLLNSPPLSIDSSSPSHLLHCSHNEPKHTNVLQTEVSTWMYSEMFLSNS